MNIQMARFTVKPNRVTEFEEAAKGVFSVVQKKQLKGIRYTLCRLSDGLTYLGLLKLGEGVNNPLPELPEGKKFIESLQNWTAEPPTRDQLTAIGWYQSP